MPKTRSITVALALMALGSPGAAGAQDTLGGVDPSVALGPTARLDWSVPDRYGAGWRAWDPATARYRRDYVQADGAWALDVNACGSLGHGSSITRHEVTLAGVGHSFSATDREGCMKRFRRLPRLGFYDVTLVVRDGRGMSAQLTRRVELRDHLVVSLGDSMASGEGVPDSHGKYKIRRLPLTRTALRRFLSGERPEYAVVEQRRAERWQDRRCHRSARSGHALVAEQLERGDPKSSVTFISLSCSGARIEHILDKGYEGQEPGDAPSPRLLAPQLDELRRAIAGRRLGEPARRVDALLLAIGINDLDFSGIVTRCSTNASAPRGDAGCVYEAGELARLRDGRLARAYDRLGDALDSQLADPEVYITDYPGDPFGGDDSRGGCGLLGLPLMGIKDNESQAMAGVGQLFANEIRLATERKRWNHVPGMSEAFRGHDYCQGDRLLVQLEESLRRQGNKYGAVHPNRDGHAQLAQLLRRAVVVGRPALPYWRATLTITELLKRPMLMGAPATARAAAAVDEPDSDEPIDPPSDTSPSPKVRITLFRPGADEIRTYDVPEFDRWVAVPPGALTFELDVYAPPRPPRYATSVGFGANAILGGHHDFGELFGAGVHEVEHPRGKLAIRYRIDLERIDRPLVNAGPA